MIICIKKEEIDSIISKLSDIEDNFWLQYKNRSENNRIFLEAAFDELYDKIYKLYQAANQPEKLYFDVKED